MKHNFKISLHLFQGFSYSFQVTYLKLDLSTEVSNCSSVCGWCSKPTNVNVVVFLILLVLLYCITTWLQYLVFLRTLGIRQAGHPTKCLTGTAESLPFHVFDCPQTTSQSSLFAQQTFCQVKAGGALEVFDLSCIARCCSSPLNYQTKCQRDQQNFLNSHFQLQKISECKLSVMTFLKNSANFIYASPPSIKGVG